ncbi:unnamed protein product [Caenorhabditis sp. 36 PRJEB53466]|nr:unnamed protein product [Caenorhabditis sp. 36 PRJEB53466]
MSANSECKLMKGLRVTLTKAMAIIEEIRREKREKEMPKMPEEIEMEVFWRQRVVRFVEPEEKWSEVRYRFNRVESKPIDIPRPVREECW